MVWGWRLLKVKGQGHMNWNSWDGYAGFLVYLQVYFVITVDVTGTRQWRCHHRPAWMWTWRSLWLPVRVCHATPAWAHTRTCRHVQLRKLPRRISVTSRTPIAQVLSTSARGARVQAGINGQFLEGAGLKFYLGPETGVTFDPGMLGNVCDLWPFW